MHQGSLYTAVASYLDARACEGRWLLRIEDVDRPREVPGSAARIVETLRAFGFEWDGDIVRQSQRTERYAAALAELRARGLTFECSCSRAVLEGDERYPGNCRAGPLIAGVPSATRLRVDPGGVEFTDLIQGRYRQDVAAQVGDAILKRRDGLYAYLLAVVVDDADQGVTRVVRGADLLDHTPRQIYLQRRLGLATPSYGHLPVLVEGGGAKLAKSARSVCVDGASALPQLLGVFGLLGLAPPAGLAQGSLREAWAWAVPRWDIPYLARRLTLPVAALKSQ